jgi:hypothetical protein
MAIRWGEVGIVFTAQRPTNPARRRDKLAQPKP